ncbi:MAG: alkyl sulfatase dimerization domain-containing protein [Acidimicrobiales bacterium]
MADVHTDLSFDDTQDFEDAQRGFIAALEPGIVHDESGRVIWDNDSYGFLEEDCPPTAHPSLWRQSRLNSIQGLFEVTEGIYQVRGLDLSNMTVVEGKTGVIVIDPLVSMETAAAALALYREHRGDRPVRAVIYTHSHIDHFGGVKGVVGQEAVDRGDVVVLAPQGFLAHAVAENVYAGTAMARRAVYMYGRHLARGPEGQIGCGLGQAASDGAVGLIAPTRDVTLTGQVEVLDGVTIEFQLTPGTEAPAEMNFLFADHAALCVAENATHNLHNLVTLRGALVRDPHEWARYLTEAIALFSDRTDVTFASHHWPTWGRERGREFLALQRDLYAYLHDQTLRRLNQGLTGSEIAETFELPDALEASWHLRGYYGSVSHNVKAVYQRYLGWFDGNPAHLWAHPPVAAATRYVAAMGGADAAIGQARAALADDDPRWAAEVLNHVVFDDPGNETATSLLAEIYDRLGQGAENATWRNFFLTGALELRSGVEAQPQAIATDLLSALSVDQVFDAMAIRLDGPGAAADGLASVIDWHITDLDVHYRVTVRNGVVVPEPLAGPPDDGAADARYALTRAELLPVLVGLTTVDPVDGDPAILTDLQAHLDRFEPDFSIVTP